MHPDVGKPEFLEFVSEDLGIKRQYAVCALLFGLICGAAPAVFYPAVPVLVFSFGAAPVRSETAMLSVISPFAAILV